MISELRKELHTPLIPNNPDKITALAAIAITPRISDPTIAGTARSTAEKYATSIILIPANRNPRK
jgi:hypothetical protein